MHKLLFPIFIPLLFFSCNLYRDDVQDFVAEGLKPIYGDPSMISTIELLDTIPMENPGKIVYLEPYLFVNEVGKGIHVIDNRNPVNPVKEAFISIPFNRDLAVQNKIIYADNNQDLISIRYHSRDSIQLIDRKENVFEQLSAFPEDYSGYFECIDTTKGQVTGWLPATLRNPECRTF